MVKTPSENDTFFGLDISESRKAFFSFRRKISKRILLIEFGVDYLNYGEARVFQDQVFCSKLNKISIDKSVIERGTPTDAETMASFLSQIIEEDQIWAHRVAVTLPPQAALSKIIYLPEDLDYNQAIDYVMNPSSSGFQFPISIENTDFDLIPLDFLPIKKKNHTKPFFLSSVPKKLVDNIIKTLTDANLELHSLDIAYSSLERLARTTISELEINQVYILIELSLECSHLFILSTFGPVYITTLAAIRAFELNNNYDDNSPIEEQVINSDDYSEISELDLKVLLNEVENELNNFKKEYNMEVSEIILSGINSSHSGITNFFKDRFKIKTSVLRAISSNEIGDLNLSKPILIQDLNRLIGLSLDIVQREEYIYKDSNKDSRDRSNKKMFKDKTNNQSNDKKVDLEIENRSNNVENNEEDKLKTSNSDSVPFEDFLSQTVQENKIKSQSLNQTSASLTYESLKNIESSLDFSSSIENNSKNNSDNIDTLNTLNSDNNSFESSVEKDDSSLDLSSSVENNSDNIDDLKNIDYDRKESENNDEDDYDFNMP